MQALSLLPSKTRKLIKKVQLNEAIEKIIYENIARRVKNKKDKQIIKDILSKEKQSIKIFLEVLNKQIKPKKIKIIWYKFLTQLFGYTFVLKIIKKKNVLSNNHFKELETHLPNITKIKTEEEKYENDLIEKLNEERLSYLGSIVLGLNDALVELTGAIAGLTFAISNTKLISLSALITGIAASLSMASSQYLSINTQGEPNAKKSAIYTGITYLATVIIMVLPYLFIQNNKFLALAIMLISVVLIIYFFNHYISVAKNQPFKAKFFQMICISLGVATISFGIGYFIKIVLAVDV